MSIMLEGERKSILADGLEYLQSKLSEFVAARLSSAIEQILNSCDESSQFLLDLSPSKYLILALIHSLTTQDTILSLILIQHLNSFVPKLSRHLKVWLKEEVLLGKCEVKNALDFLHLLEKSGLLKGNSTIIEILEVHHHNETNCINENSMIRELESIECHDSNDTHLLSDCQDKPEESLSLNNTDSPLAEDLFTCSNKSSNNGIENFDKKRQSKDESGIESSEDALLNTCSSLAEENESPTCKIDAKFFLLQDRVKKIAYTNFKTSTIAYSKVKKKNTSKNEERKSNKGMKKQNIIKREENVTRSKSEETLPSLLNMEIKDLKSQKCLSDDGLVTVSETQETVVHEERSTGEESEHGYIGGIVKSSKSEVKRRKVGRPKAELHWAPYGTAWRPFFLTLDIYSVLAGEEMTTQILYRKVRGILNKLTFEKFLNLVDQFLVLPIDTAERLKAVVEMVVEKAITESLFVRVYSKLCMQMGKLVVKESGEDSYELSFRKILLTLCQEIFENITNKETGKEGKKIDGRIGDLQKLIAAEVDKEKKKTLLLYLQEEEIKIRNKRVGLAMFIGELFKLNMLTANIMHVCIKTLLEKIDEESLECLCKLLTTAGKELEAQSPGHSKDLDEYFNKMRKLSQKSANSKVSSRVRFMLQDVIELRSNRWVPRRDENNPKTMEQIQKDAERETMMETALLQSNTPRSKHNDRNDRLRGAPRGGGGGNNNQDPDGWHVSTYKFRTFAFEPSKLQHLKGIDNEPAGGLSLGLHRQFSQWNSGSNAKRSGGSEPKRPELANKFALLGADDRKSITSMMGPRKAATPSSSLEKERAVQSVREDRGQSSNPPSRDSSRVRDKSSQPPQTPVAEQEQPPVRAQTPMDPEKAKKRSRELFEEWILNHNEEETVTSIKEVFSEPMHFVKPVLDTVLEGKPHQRLAFGELLVALLSKEVISPADVSQELTACIEIGEDLMIDLPFVWIYLAELLIPILSKGLFTFADLKVACEPCRTPHLSKTLTEIINQLLKTKGPGFIRTQWETSKVKFSDFIPEAQVDEFIKSNVGGEEMRKINRLSLVQDPGSCI